MSDIATGIDALIAAIEVKVSQELKFRCEAYEPDVSHPEIYSVVTALLARQTTLAMQLASAPQLWNRHSAPLFLRAMADVHITLSWILCEPTIRARRYIEHGLGQAVLSVDHKKSKLGDTDEETKEKVEAYINAEESWINIQKLTFLVDVNIGSWSGKTTRDMAEEAGILDFYNHVYMPFSQCAHSTWAHVGKFNSSQSASPLTRPFWIPQIAERGSQIWDLHLLAKYLDKSFNVFDEKALKKAPSSRIRGWIYDEIQSRFGSEAPKPEPDGSDQDN